MKKMGLVTVCLREKRRAMFSDCSAATHSGAAALFCLPCLVREGEQVTLRQRQPKRQMLFVSMTLNESKSEEGYVYKDKGSIVF